MDITSDEMYNTHVVRHFRISFAGVSVVIFFLFPFLN